MTPKNERTSTRVSAIAGRVLRAARKHSAKRPVCVIGEEIGVRNLCSIGELKALAASCLTQAPEKKPRKRRKVAKK